VLDTIARLHRMGFWVEIVTLVVPGFNDSAEELAEIAAFIAGVSPDIPWHVTAFHADYRMEAPTTPRAKLVEAVALGRRAGLKFVYAGNLAGDAGEMENTACPVCGERLIERRGYFISAYRLTAEGACPRCHTKIPGRWAEKYTGQMASHPFLP
jgi:pyruvate formate lyase activating enzyme